MGFSVFAKPFLGAGCSFMKVECLSNRIECPNDEHVDQHGRNLVPHCSVGIRQTFVQ